MESGSEARGHSLDQRFLEWKETQTEINTEMTRRQAAIGRNLQLITEVMERIAEKSADTEIKLNRLIERFDNWIAQLQSRNGR